jgi:hypothetical protein
LDGFKKERQDRCDSVPNGDTFPVGRSMANLQLKNSSMVQECLDNAIQWKRRAASVRDPAAKVVFTQLARCWQEIARSWREFDKSSPTT